MGNAVRLAWLGSALLVMMAAAPVLHAREAGLTCAEKYRAAKESGRLKRGVTEQRFMDKCASETRHEQSRQLRAPHHG